MGTEPHLWLTLCADLQLSEAAVKTPNTALSSGIRGML